MSIDAADFARRVSEADITESEINRLQVEVLYGRILNKADRLEISQTLGVLKAILMDARS